MTVPPTTHDAQLDYYGRRLATASSDRTIRLFDVEGDDNYRLVDTLQGHDGPIHALAWAHPSFGSILASCSFDGKVFIWKEDDGPQKGWAKVKEHLLHTASGVSSGRIAVNAIAWAPHELGPILACASSDGKVSVLTFNNDGTWEASLFPAHALGVTSISWAPGVGIGALTTPQGGAGPDGQEVLTQVRRFATGGESVLPLFSAPVKVREKEMAQSLTGNCCCSDQTKEWAPDPVEHVLQGHSDWVRDVAWAPSVGVGKAYLASAGQDKTVYIWTQTDSQSPWTRTALEPSSSTTSAPSQPGQQPPASGGEGKFGDVVWRVSWSVAGNVLAVSSGAFGLSLFSCDMKRTLRSWVTIAGDGKVSLWKESIKGVFEEVSELTS
ncbi:SPOSA6832_00189, partial [Sporobolomyces salmonicolor]